LRKKTQAEVERAKVTKTVRTLVRLKHSLKADEEINAVLPDTLDEFEAALANGDLKGLTASLDDALGNAASE
jgi:hypothetical protein